MTQRARRRQRRTGRKRGKIFLGLGVLISLIAIGVLGVGIWALGVAAEAPDLDELKPINKGADSVVFAADGSRLGVVASDQIRTPVPLRKVPKVVQNATIAIEDARFYDHAGVDLSAIVRAAIKDIEAGEVVQGGSTITQQLVKNLYTNETERDLEAKIREAKLAEELENERSKRWILRQYLNTASYGTVDGRTSIGIEAAARTYFSKPAEKLGLTEAALIAGLPQSPSRFNPLQNPGPARARRNEVIEAMAEAGYISTERAERARRANLGLDPGIDSYTEVREPYFFDFVVQQLIDRYGPNTVRKGGLEIHTTIDPALQETARAAIDGQLNLPDDPSAALVTIHPENGHVLAMASSSTFEDRQYNLAAQGQRQPGSAFKTMVLTAAVRQGIDPSSTTYTSRPLNLNLPEYGPWEVATYSNSYSGSMTLDEATLASDNTVYAQLDLDVGPENVTQTAKDLGISSKLNSLPAEGIGGLEFGVTPLEMANAYATLAAGGVRSRPIAISRVEFPDGKVDEIGKPKREPVFEDGVAAEVTGILERNIQSGTGTAASIGCPAAGKTGTTDDFRDAWFAGYTPDKATAVWVGYPDEQRSMSSVHGIAVAGGTFPARIWGDYMEVAKGGECSSFPAPENSVSLSSFSGGTYAGAPEDDDRYYPSDSGEDPIEFETGGAPADGEEEGSGSGDEPPEFGDYDSDAYAPGIQEPGGNRGGSGQGD